MIKYAILAFILFIAYRMFSDKPRISEKPPGRLDDQEPDDPGYSDYEEVD